MWWRLLTHIARATSCPLLLLLALGGASSSGSELVSSLLSPRHANLHTDTTTTLYTAAFLPLKTTPKHPSSICGLRPIQRRPSRPSSLPLFRPSLPTMAALSFFLLNFLILRHDLQVHSLIYFRDLERKTRSQPPTTTLRSTHGQASGSPRRLLDLAQTHPSWRLYQNF